MTERLRTMSLMSDSVQFVFSHLGMLKHHLVVIFPLILVCGLADVIGQNMGHEWLNVAAFVPSLYLYACFALSWHRTSLQGPDKAHRVNPFSWEAGRTRFMLAFSAVFLMPFIVGGLTGLFIGFVSAQNNPYALGAAAIVSFVVFCMLLVELIRFSFKLPANSVGVALSLRDARKAARGLVLRILLAGSIVTVGFFLAVSLYGLIVGLGLGMILQGEEPGMAMSIFTGFFLSIPIHAGAMVLTAVNVTILSKAYQWGMQNNG